MATQEEDDYSSPLEEDTDEDVEDLSTQIIAKYEQSQFDPDTKMFLPAGLLEDLLTEEAIIKELAGKSRLDPKDLVLRQGSEKKRMVDFIRQNAKRVFATTVVSEFCGEDLRLAMRIFKKIDFTDECLPVLQDESLSRQVSKFSKKWKPTKIYRFCREQWHFLSPVFSPWQTKFSLDPNHVLPFMEKSSGSDVQEGAFSQVFCIKIHPAHQINPVKDVGSL
jgi:hypothetical protein